jgi:aldehyde dehydrogenase (NAD+)/betaine-aldehyde dehydrogenase
MLIDGERVEIGGNPNFPSINPADETIIAEIPAADGADVERAVCAAESAQCNWWAVGWPARAAAMRALAAELAARSTEIVALECADTGNTIRQLHRDVEIAAANLHYFAGMAAMLTGETYPASSDGFHISVRCPYGVVARIVPFNHPFMFAAARIAAPLAAGNTIVLKTPEQSPLSAGILAEACTRHLPRGVVNIIHGHGAVAGDYLVRHPRVRRIGFTGSVSTGLAIQRAAAETGVKHVSLELGGKNPLIAGPDMSAAEIVEAALAGMNFAWAGQSCGSTSRLFVHIDVYNAVVALLRTRMDALVVGDPQSITSDMGPVNSSAQLARVTDYIRSGQQDGARLIAGGSRPSGPQFTRGYWVRPTAFVDVDARMRIAQEEIFGPVLSVFRWQDPEGLLQQVNGVQYGLTAAIWTKDYSFALDMARRIKAGYVWVNSISKHFLGTPFGGTKNSGVGVEECLEELHSYSESKTIHMLR